MDKPEYLAEQLAIAEMRVQTTTGAEREEWKRRIEELHARARSLGRNHVTAERAARRKH